MSVIKKVMIVLILLLVVSVAWVSFAVYHQTVGLDIDQNAKDYTTPISSTFDEETLDGVTGRTNSSFPVSPSEFLRLNSTD